MSDAIDGVTGVSSLNDLLDNYRVPPGSRATILEAVAAVQAEGATVVGRVVGADVELSPDDGTVAVAVGPSRLTLTLDRRSAVRAVQQHEFCRLEDTSAGSAGLSMEQWAVQQHAVVVRNLVVAALRAAVPVPGPTSTGRVGRAAGPTGAPRTARTTGTARAGRTAKPAAAPALPPPKPAVCPVHFVQLVNGRCDYCDD